MPHPMISSQPVPLQTLHPLPPQRLHETSTSADGSVKGKYDGTHADGGLLAEDLLGEVEQRLLHVGKRNPLVDVETLDLVEDAVGAVGDGLVAEDRGPGR